MAINGRRKGNKAERVAAKLISDWTGHKFERTPSSGGLQWKASHAKGDITATDEHRCPFCFEVKSYAKIDFSHLINPKIKNPDILQYWSQASRDAGKVNKIPMLMMRYNGLPKSFYFIVLERRFWKKVRVELGSFNYLIFSGMNQLVILPSTEFFKVNYKFIRKIAKTYLNESKRK